MRISKTILPFSLLLIFGFAFNLSAQDEIPPSRSITSLDLKSKRPSSAAAGMSGSVNKPDASAKKTSAVLSSSKRRYEFIKRNSLKKIANNKTKVKTARKLPLKAEELGVTFWRLRLPAGEDEDTPLFPVRIGNKIEKWAAERVSSTTVFKKGDRIRFTIEPSRSGYLYIANREVYADGTNGNANIIFPTLRSRGGDNRVQAGSLIEIPSSEDSVAFYTINPQRDDYVGEEIIILILPDQLPRFETGLRAQPLAADKLADWFAKWESQVDVYDAEDGEGVFYTEIEARTATTATRTLSQDAPLPQTLYKALIRENDPLFISFRLQTSP